MNAICIITQIHVCFKVWPNTIIAIAIHSMIFRIVELSKVSPSLSFVPSIYTSSIQMCIPEKFNVC